MSTMSSSMTLFYERIRQKVESRRRRREGKRFSSSRRRRWGKERERASEREFPEHSRNFNRKLIRGPRESASRGRAHCDEMKGPRSGPESSSSNKQISRFRIRGYHNATRHSFIYSLSSPCVPSSQGLAIRELDTDVVPPWEEKRMKKKARRICGRPTTHG